MKEITTLPPFLSLMSFFFKKSILYRFLAAMPKQSSALFVALLTLSEAVDSDSEFDDVGGSSFDVDSSFAGTSGLL